MCLSVPAKIIEIKGDRAIVDFGQSQREVSIMLIKNPKVGDYVLVHAGFAIELLDEAEAKITLNAFKEMYD
jgi:hydrogenase expression/formation protein HypC